jgi:hypothetical protein
MRIPAAPIVRRGQRRVVATRRARMAAVIATLLVEGTPNALSAAAQITKGVEQNLCAVGLKA